jgi:hypothetical protein
VPYFLQSWKFGSRWGGLSDAIGKSKQVIGERAPRLGFDVKAMLFTKAFVCCTPEFHSPRHISLAIAGWVFTETMQWTSGSATHGAMVTAATLFHIRLKSFVGLCHDSASHVTPVKMENKQRT